VATPIILSDADLSSILKVSEIAVVQCVIKGYPPDLTVNWTGIPLFHILTLARIKAEATKVVFRSRPPDSYSSALKIEDALSSTILVATETNGVPLTSLSEIAPGHIGGYRHVVPGRYGYKWVANLASIEAVDYDYLGTYESSGYADEALIPESSWTIEERAYLPAVIVPPLETFAIPYGNRSFEVQAFTNVSISGFHFDIAQKSVGMNFTVPAGSAGFTDVIIQQVMIAGPY
jgi:DMSO/TMAO reductase YedYZ molybdopterin-dependent catalytic subunit